MNDHFHHSADRPGRPDAGDLRATRDLRRHHHRERGPRAQRGDFGPGFGRGFGLPFGPGSTMGRGRRAGIRRGDVRSAILTLLAEAPMHGYQIMQLLAERSGGIWQPSAGSIYPTLQQLEDEGLVTSCRAGRTSSVQPDRVRTDQRGRAGEARNRPLGGRRRR